MTVDLRERTLAWLTDALGARAGALELSPSGNSGPVDDPTATSVALPAAAGADYGFTVWFYEGGDAEIAAHLVDAAGQRVPAPTPGEAAGASFWYQPFELEDYERSLERLADAFEATLRRVLTHETRVRQRRGWLFWHFALDVRTSDGAWEPVYGYGALRAGVPGPVHRATREFTAPPLLDASTVPAAVRA